MTKRTKEKIYTQEEIAKLKQQLRVAEASVPMHCRKCKEQLKRNEYYEPDSALKILFIGGYGMYFDDSSVTFYVCHQCADLLLDFLIDEL